MNTSVPVDEEDAGVSFAIWPVYSWQRVWSQSGEVCARVLLQNFVVRQFVFIVRAF